MEFLANAWKVCCELAPWLFVGLGAAGLLHRFVPADLPQRALGKPGLGSILRAVLVGVPLPLCSCAVIPAAGALRKKGASRGASLAFLISTPQTGVDSIAVTASMLSWPFALFKVVVALVTGVVGGVLTDGLHGDGAETEGEAKARAAVADEPVLSFVDSLLYTIWRWLAIGIFVAAAISTWLPPDLFGSWGLTGPAAMFAALAISVPLYVCATSSVPIAAALVASGLPVGAAIVFLMAGPATNVATIGAVYRLLGGRALGVYLTTVCGFSMLASWLFDGLFEPAGGLTPDAHHHTSALAMFAAALLLALFARYLVRDLRYAFAPTLTGGLSIVVDGITCKGCVAKIQRTLAAAPGVDTVQVSIETDTVTVTGSDPDAPRICSLLADAGFPPREAARPA